MMLLTLLGVLLLALYVVASTAPTFSLEVSDMSDAQAWADELEASLCPYQRAVDMGLAPSPWAMPPKLAALLATAEPKATRPTTHKASRKRVRRQPATEVRCG